MTRNENIIYPLYHGMFKAKEEKEEHTKGTLSMAKDR